MRFANGSVFMVGMTRNWIVRQLSLGEFDSHRDVWGRAAVMAGKIAALAYGLNLLSHFLLYGFGLLPYSLVSALIIATALTPPLAFLVAFVAYLVIGFAIHDLRVSRAELERLSLTDMLSGLANRRAFLERFDQCDRDKSLLIIDIDRFKLVNDNHGHAVGDQVIVAVANMLSTVFGDQGVCARIGGEEFAVFSGMTFAEFNVRAEILRSRIAGMTTEVGEGQCSVTVSGGIARALPGQTFGEVFSCADKALYAAKTGGRNRIVVSHGAGVPEPDQVKPVAA